MPDAFEDHLRRLSEAILSVTELHSEGFSIDIGSDIDAIVDGFRLQKVRRYFQQYYWWEETTQAELADSVEPDLKLENVAAHSWHVADTALLLVDRFDHLQADKVLRLAILHDKLEMYTGDFDPVGLNGKGNNTHAFNQIAQAQKAAKEREALTHYLSSLRLSVRHTQESLIEENIMAETLEARFVKAVDKIQALAFVHEKKKGEISDGHVIFSLRYSSKTLDYFPELFAHYACLASRFLQRISDHRGTTVKALLKRINSEM